MIKTICIWFKLLIARRCAWCGIKGTQLYYSAGLNFCKKCHKKDNEIWGEFR